MKSFSKYMLIFLLCVSYTLSSLKFLQEPKIKTEPEVIKANVRYNSRKGTYQVEIGDLDEKSAAYGTYTKSMEEIGWDKLAISSYQGQVDLYSDSTRAYAMGYLEGYLTTERIWSHYTNLRNLYYFENNGVMTVKVKDFLNANLQWMKDTSIQNRSSDVYWNHIYTIVRQMEGLIAGYNANVDDSKKLTYAEFQIMNAMGDLDELGFWEESKIPDFQKMSAFQILEYIETHSHCSAMIKVAADFSDVWFGHNTWTSYSTMNRIFKEYRFKSSKGTEKSKTVALSGYPGTLSSVDDFYITDRDLYVTETTNQIFNKDLYKTLTHKSLLTWIRSIVANRLSDDGKTWASVFAQYNSGTYNNQFQILDLKLIDTEQKIIQDNALWIIEQMPGYTESADVTETLRYGYWPSYNSAYFKAVREKSGYDDILVKQPELKDSIDYDSCVRANIMRRDQHNVKDLESYKKFIRYNDWKNDPLSKNNPGMSIACRKDLAADPECRGATDAKVASIKDIKGTNKKKITIISGPTSDIQDPFDYSTAVCAKKTKYVFNGLPQKFTYKWTEYVTTLFDN